MRLPDLRSLKRPRATAILVLVAALLAACTEATGEVRRGPEPYRPIADALAQAPDGITYPWQSPTGGGPLGSGSIVQATPGSGSSSGATAVRILAGGTGVSLRSDCADGARAGGAWTDNTSVDVVEYGSGRCEEWVRVRSSSIVSWVREEYLAGLPPADQRGTPAAVEVVTPSSPSVAQLHTWTVGVLDGAGRVALMARHSPESKESALTVTFLEDLGTDMQGLVREIGAAAPTGIEPCDGARRPLIDATNAIAEMAKRLQAGFVPDAQLVTGLESLAARYAAALREAARLTNDCAKR